MSFRGISFYTLYFILPQLVSLLFLAEYNDDVVYCGCGRVYMKKSHPLWVTSFFIILYLILFRYLVLTLK